MGKGNPIQPEEFQDNFVAGLETAPVAVMNDFIEHSKDPGSRNYSHDNASGSSASVIQGNIFGAHPKTSRSCHDDTCRTDRARNDVSY